MADNLDFTTATFATNAMLPDADEELTADWMRKMMENTAKAAGYVGTLIATNTSVATLGTAKLYFTGFEFPPVIEMYCYEQYAGTLAERIGPWADAYTPAAESGRITGKRMYTTGSFLNGTGTLVLEVYPHPHLSALGPENANFNQADHGTWLYRLRGA
jgi:hypothetical protein